MVDMSMRQQHALEFRGFEAKGASVERTDYFGALEHAAIDQYFSSPDFQQMAGPRHAHGSTQKSQIHDLKFTPHPIRLFPAIIRPLNVA